LTEHFESIRKDWEGSLAKNTYSSYTTAFKTHILPAIGSIAIGDLSRKQLKSFVNDLRTKIAKIPGNAPARTLSKATIKNTMMALQSALSAAVEDGTISINPAEKLGKYYKEVNDFREEIDPFTSQEAEQLLQTALTMGHETYSLLLVLL